MYNIRAIDKNHAIQILIYDILDGVNNTENKQITCTKKILSFKNITN